MQKLTSRLIAWAAFAAAASAPSVARAEAPLALPVDVSRVIESSFDWLQTQTKPGASGASKPATASAATISLRSNLSPDKTAAEPTAPLLNPPIRLALVARDWGKAYGIAGRKTISDDVRLSRSSRMLIGRARLDLGPVQPFAQIGLGEWRYDPTLMTLLPANQEYATQLAAGFELRIAKHARIGVEADYTLLVREVREKGNHPDPRVLGAFAVMHTKF